MNKKIKLCIIVPAHWDALMGGSQYQAKLLIDHILSLGNYDVYYLTCRIAKGNAPLGYRIIQISELSGIRRYGHFLDAIKLYKILNAIKPDVIYQMVGSAYTGIATYYAKRSGCRMIWRITSDKSVSKCTEKGLRRFLPHKYIEQKITEYGIKNAGLIIAQTEHQGHLLLENYNRVPSAVISNYHPVPETEVIIKGEQLAVLWIANFKRIKQPEIFVKLASDLQDLNYVRFVMVGSPPADEQWFDYLKAKIQVQSNLEYLGALTQDEVNALLARSHVLVNTSEYEGLSNAFIQAWLREVPVISLNSNPDNLLGDGYLGYCADGDYDRLVQVTRKVLQDFQLIKSIGSRARQYASHAYSENNIQALMKHFC